MRQPENRLAHFTDYAGLFIQINDFAAFSQALTSSSCYKAMAFARILAFACVFCCFAVASTFAAIDASTMYLVTSADGACRSNSKTRQSQSSGSSSDQGASLDRFFHDVFSVKYKISEGN
jgi:hypothetical protein